MDASVSIIIDAEEYGIVTATYGGTNIARFWNDPSLEKFMKEAVSLAGEGKDLFDFSNFLFSQINNSIKRRYGGQELQLKSVEVNNLIKKVTSY